MSSFHYREPSREIEPKVILLSPAKLIHHSIFFPQKRGETFNYVHANFKTKCRIVKKAIKNSRREDKKKQSGHN